MLGKDDVRAFQEEFDCQANARDRAAIDDHTSAQGQLYAEYLLRADEQGIDAKPVPHIHEADEEVADRCRLGHVLATVGGIAVAILLTIGAVKNRLIGALGAIVAFLVAQAILELGVSTLVDRRTFMLRFRVFYLPGLVLFGVSISVVLLGRFAGTELADELLQLNAWAWWGLEISLLILGSCAGVGRRRFGWSGVIFREYEACERAITALKLKIERRASARTVASKVAVGVLAFLVFLSSPQSATAQGTFQRERCATGLLDRTGSVLYQKDMEDAFRKQVVQNSDRLPCLNVVIVSTHVFSAQRVPVRWHAVSPEPPIFIPIEEASRRRLQRQVDDQLQAILQAPLRPAPCTSVPDILARASLESKPVVVLTDAYHDCAPVRPQQLSNDADILVVVFRSKGDRGGEAAVFQQRRNEILKFLPNAEVFPEFLLDQAFARVVARFSGGPLLKTSVRE